LRRRGTITNYERGYQVELKAKRRIEEDKDILVIRSSRSLTPIDLIAINKRTKEIMLIQCKKEKVSTDKARLAKRFSELKSLEGTYSVKAVLYAKVNGRYRFIQL